MIDQELTFEKDDIFKRRHLSESLMSICNRNTEPLAIAIDSYWGSGKSTFLAKWRNEIDEKGYKTVFIDAWENDFYQDPFIPLIGEIESLLDLQDASGQDLKNALLTVLKEVLKATTRFVDIDNIQESFRNEARDNLTQYKSLKVQKYFISKKLKEYASNQKVFFFIDELDRCKPLFAIHFLERIKHFLNIDNFVFVFAVDLSQLGKSVQSVYGQIDTSSYFRKFFDFSLSLPEPSTTEYLRYMMKSSNMIHLWNDNYVKYTMKLIEKHSNVGLRECEKIFNIINVGHDYINGVSGNEYIFPILLLFKVAYPERYKKFLSKDFVLTIAEFEEWDLKDVYPNDYEHIIKMVNGLGHHDWDKRHKKAVEQFGTLAKSETRNGYLEYANAVIELANLF